MALLFTFRNFSNFHQYLESFPQQLSLLLKYFSFQFWFSKFKIVIQYHNCLAFMESENLDVWNAKLSSLTYSGMFLYCFQYSRAKGNCIKFFFWRFFANVFLLVCRNLWSRFFFTDAKSYFKRNFHIPFTRS